jgi:enoyl-[acyl-carrier protein] reductase I
MNLKGKIVFVAGVGDDQGFGWAIAKSAAEAGATLIFCIWPPVYGIFTKSWEMGKFDASRKLANGGLMQVARFLPLDAMYDTMAEVPEEVRTNKRYAEHTNYGIHDVAQLIHQEYGRIDCVVHSLANAPEVKNPLLQTSRRGYLDAMSASAYSFVSMVRHFGPVMNAGGSVITLTYRASVNIIPGYGGGMSSAKAALESDTRMLAYEAGRAYNIRVNAISAGPWASRAARAIGFIDKMIAYSQANAPLLRDLSPEDVAATALFLLSPASAAITGEILFVDNGLHAMGISTDSPTLQSTATE